jgi:hypothetical protein
MLNSPWFAVTLAHRSTCSQGYPQKMWMKLWTFTTMFSPYLLPLRGQRGSVFAAGSLMAPSKECLWPDSTVAYGGFWLGCGLCALHVQQRAAQSGAADDAAQTIRYDGALCAGGATNDGRCGGGRLHRSEGSFLDHEITTNAMLGVGNTRGSTNSSGSVSSFG